MLGLLPENSPQTVNVYFIQLPKKENAERALGMINEKLQIK
jgi:hypothetical protein